MLAILIFHMQLKRKLFYFVELSCFFPPKYLEIKLASRQTFQIWILYTGKPFYEINKNHVQWRVQKNALRNLPIWTFFCRKKYLLACMYYMHIILRIDCNVCKVFLHFVPIFGHFWWFFYIPLSTLSGRSPLSKIIKNDQK